MSDFSYFSTTRPDALATGLTAVATDVLLSDGSTFPDPALYGGKPYTIILAYGTSREEVCTVTAKPTASTLTVTRGQDGTPAAAKNAGDVVVHGVSARDFRSIADKVDIAGDTMTGSLTVAPTSGEATVSVVAPTASAGRFTVGSQSGPASVELMTGSSRRWLLSKTAEPETGSNAGSNFALLGYTDAGAPISTVLSFNRATGLGAVAGDPTAGLGIATKQYVDSADGTLVRKSGDTMTGSLTVSATGQHIAATGANPGGNSMIIANPSSGPAVITAVSTSSTANLNVRASSGFAANVAWQGAGGVTRWNVVKDGAVESGGNAGSDLRIYRYDDAGVSLGQVLGFSRSTGLGTVAADPTAPLGIATKGYVDDRTKSAQVSTASYVTGGLSVAFPSPFSSVPRVVAGATVSLGTSTPLHFMVFEVTTSGFKYKAFTLGGAERAAGQPCLFDYIATIA